MLLSISNLSIVDTNLQTSLIDDITIDVDYNQTVAIIGESGSGKSLTAMSILQLLPASHLRITTGNISFEDTVISQIKISQLRTLRGKEIGVVFQDPMSSLNPSFRCGNQVEEVLLQHRLCKRSEAYRRTLTLFERVRLPEPQKTFSKYPHQLSGGEKQRVMIAMAIACEPKLLIADEPTTALDVTVQREIIDLLSTLKKQTNMSIIFISHDLSLVAQIADHIAIMQRGRIVEQGNLKSIFYKPKHSYTRALLATRISLDRRIDRLPTVGDIDDFDINKHIVSAYKRAENIKKISRRPILLQVDNISKSYNQKPSLFTRSTSFKAVDKVSFNIHRGETLGLVGESGCGKTTLGNIILRIEKPSEGSIIFDKKNLNNLPARQMRVSRKDIQMIFQDPYASLNPMLSVGTTIVEPMRVHGLYASDKIRKYKAQELLERVGLNISHFDRLPRDFSGGQRQRIGIARAIALMPKLIVCDEVVSALDISSQAQVLNLLNDLKRDFGLTYLFISHDLAVVKHMSDRLLVMRHGKVVEQGESDSLYAYPESTYTQQLINAIPRTS